MHKTEILSEHLSWSHYVELLKVDDPVERQFYSKQCEQENWSVRELKRQIKSMLFHRLALSKNKEEVLALAKQGVQPQQAKDIIKDPYVFEFLGIPQQEQYLEGDLEAKLIDNLEKFLLEFGQMNLYLNYFRKEESRPDDNLPIGLVLGAHKDHILMEYATEHITNHLIVSKYLLHLPNKEELKNELEKLLNDE